MQIRKEVIPMVMGYIFLGMLCSGFLSGFCISRAISNYEKIHDGEDWGDDL